MSMDRDALRAWIADRPEIAEQLLRVLARRLRRTNNNLADLIFTDVPGRWPSSCCSSPSGSAPRRAGAAGHPRPDPGGDRPARRRLPGDGQQGTGRLRPPRLDPPGGQERADQRLRASDRRARRPAGSPAGRAPTSRRRPRVPRRRRVDVLDDLPRGRVLTERTQAERTWSKRSRCARYIALTACRSSSSGPCPGSTARRPSPCSRRSDSR